MSDVREVQQYTASVLLDRAALEVWGDGGASALARAHEELRWAVEHGLEADGWLMVPGRPLLMHEVEGAEERLRNQVRVVAEARVYDRWPEGCRAAVEEDQAWLAGRRGRR